MMRHEAAAGRRSWPRKFDGERQLDELVESALAEATADERAAPAPACEEYLDADAFLADAATFLNLRPDRADLMERLRTLVLPSSNEAAPAPSTPAEVAPASWPPERVSPVPSLPILRAAEPVAGALETPAAASEARQSPE
jgi:hypothetical protein